MSFLSHGRSLFWVKKLTSFFLGQGMLQLLSALTGFLLLRWMAVDAYAQYSATFGFQCSVGILVDMGFSGAIIALVGSRQDDPRVIGQYIRSVLYYRNILFLIALPVGAAIFIWTTSRQPWGWTARALLYGSVMFTLFFQGWSSCYSAALVMHARYGAFYRTQLATTLFRLAISGALYALGVLSGVAMLWVNALGLAISAVSYRALARPLVQEPPHSDPAMNRELRRYIAPLVPQTVFNAIESQITVFLITYFGKSHNIAEVGALARLNQMLLILMVFNGVVVAPYIARLPRARLAGRYWLIVAGGCTAACGLLVLSLVFPWVLLWVIGPKYNHLRAEIPWSIACWGVYYLGSLLLTMHSARKWVFWWHTSTYCVVLALAQVVGVWLCNLNTTLGIFQFTMIGACANLAIQAVGGVYGFHKEKASGLVSDEKTAAAAPESSIEAEAPAMAAPATEAAWSLEISETALAEAAVAEERTEKTVPGDDER